MSARMTVMSLDPRFGESEIIGLRPVGPDLTPDAPWGANPAGDTLSRAEDTERLLEDLLRRFGTVVPPPWRHGGLNE